MEKSDAAADKSATEPVSKSAADYASKKKTILAILENIEHGSSAKSEVNRILESAQALMACHWSKDALKRFRADPKAAAAQEREALANDNWIFLPKPNSTLETIMSSARKIKSSRGRVKGKGKEKRRSVSSSSSSAPSSSSASDSSELSDSSDDLPAMRLVYSSDSDERPSHSSGSSSTKGSRKKKGSLSSKSSAPKKQRELPANLLEMKSGNRKPIHRPIRQALSSTLANLDRDPRSPASASTEIKSYIRLGRALHRSAIILPPDYDIQDYQIYCDGLLEAIERGATIDQVLRFDDGTRFFVSRPGRFWVDQLHLLFAGISPAQQRQATSAAGAGASSSSAAVAKEKLLCFKFNGAAGCDIVGCKYPHICRLCSSADHSATACPSRLPKKDK